MAKNIRVFIRTAEEQEQLERCCAATHESTASKALMAAAALYPVVAEQLHDAKRELERLRGERQALRSAFKMLFTDDEFAAIGRGLPPPQTGRLL